VSHAFIRWAKLRLSLLPHSATFPSDPALFRALAFHARKIRTEEDHLLFAQGDEPIGVFLVRSGTVQAVVHSDDGGVVAIFRANPGSVLGLPAVTSDQLYSLSALATRLRHRFPQ
jgi:CRP-like cAMP-binding protein